MDRNRPIGVFDSGVGGLTVVSALLRRLPAESILYLGDTARLPYGTKSPQTVARYAQRNIDFLKERGVKAAVVACNTASALALPSLELDLPTLGVVEPGAEAALSVSRRAGRGDRRPRIGVLATESTIRSDAYGKALRELDPNVEVLGQSCALFVPLVEEGWSADPVTEAIARRYLDPLLEAQVDTMVLGCTHYPVLKPVLQQIVGDRVELVDSAETIADRVAQELEQLDLLSSSETVHHHLCCTDVGERFQRIAHELLPDLAGSLSLEWVEV